MRPLALARDAAHAAAGAARLLNPFPYPGLRSYAEPRPGAAMPRWPGPLHHKAVEGERMRHPVHAARPARRRAHDDPAVGFVMWLYLAVMLMPAVHLLWEHFR